MLNIDSLVLTYLGITQALVEFATKQIAGVKAAWKIHRYKQIFL